jgi:uncharacterized protein (TIGR03435 family)
MFAMACLAQQFEIASITANTSDNRIGSFEISPGGDRLTVRNAYLGIIIQRAYGLDEMQLPKASAVPLMLAKYDIDAKAERPVNRRELMLVLRNLLTDRFKLSFHWKATEVSGYALVTVKGGPKLRPHDGDPESDCTTQRKSDGSLRYENGSMAEFVSCRLYPGMTGLCGLVNVRSINGETGIQGKYDFDFDLMASWEVGADAGERRVVNPEAPSVFTAIEKQLGLKLEGRRILVQAFQIDRLDKASETSWAAGRGPD